MAKKYTDQCACRTVTFEFDTDLEIVAVCNRLECKKASVGEAAKWFEAPENDFNLISGTPTAYSYIADSGNDWSGMSSRNVVRICSRVT